MKTDVIVLGGGAIGLTLAYELATRGRSVLVVERDSLDANNSPRRSASAWAAAGILPPANLESATDPIDRLRGLSHQLFPDLVARLAKATGIDCQLDRCGGWYLADTVGETASMIGMVSYWRDLDIECVETELSEFATREPAMAPWANSVENGHAWWVPDEYQICTPLMLQALVEGCRGLGVKFLDQTSVVDVEQSGEGAVAKVQTREKGEQAIHADQAVVCGGTWSGLISQDLKLAQSLVPVRGQMLLLQSEPGNLSGIVNFGQRYLVPRRDGSVLIGSCEEEVGFHHGTTPSVLNELREFAIKVCPSLSTARELDAWSGLRPLTFDGFPMCGKLPGSESIFVATGHYRSGIHLSPATATCLADLMSGEEPQVDLDDFRVGKQQHRTDHRFIE